MKLLVATHSAQARMFLNHCAAVEESGALVVRELTTGMALNGPAQWPGKTVAIFAPGEWVRMEEIRDEASPAPKAP